MNAFFSNRVAIVQVCLSVKMVKLKATGSQLTSRGNKSQLQFAAKYRLLNVSISFSCLNYKANRYSFSNENLVLHSKFVRIMHELLSLSLDSSATFQSSTLITQDQLHSLRSMGHSIVPCLELCRH